MDQNTIIESAGFYFIHNFDSGNLGHVERVPTELIAPSLNTRTNLSETPDYEFNLWTRPDCAGTEFENGNRTWFYFGIQASEPGVLVRLNLINLNKQGKMYNQGMAPVTRTLPGKPQWERIRDRPVHSTDDNTFTLTFKYRTADNLKATTFFAFTYPFSFAELQIALNSIDLKMLPLTSTQSPDDIYYYRECLIYSLEGRRVDLLTITSHHGITNEREDRLKHLFPDNEERPFKFSNKKIIFISARVHPGETPSSFVFNGFLNLLLTRTDPIAIQLRKLYVFKMIPFLNPDGVARGHYRTDTRGVNLNRVYLNPSLALHPTVYASRALIRYYHFGCEKEDIIEDVRSVTSRSIQNISESVELLESKKKRGPGSTISTYKRDKSKSTATNKSNTTIKQSSVDTKRDSIKTLSGEASLLAEQVYDMKLQEQKSLTSDQSAPEDTPSLLTDNVLRTCLGSNVHVSTSEELNQAGVNVSGVNPLRPLRDTLKNSISLLMESSSSNTGESISDKDSRMNNIRMGWCAACRAAVAKLESSMPGITGIVPGYNAISTDETHTYHATIDEYREHQRQQYDALSIKFEDNESVQDKSEKSDVVYFCTNCFKRYTITDQEEIKLSDVVSYASVGVSCGDNCEQTSALHEPQLCGDSTGDNVTQSPTKDDKSKSLVGRGRKKVARAPSTTPASAPRALPRDSDSGLYLYVDLHGHASKKGIFMYGNHFDDVDSCVECMLLPRIMSLNNLHFHFSSCNFTERNMYLKDRRDGMSREGSGRVAVLKATGLVRSYTLECNYNTGRLVNILPPAAKDGPGPPSTAPPPPKYTPHIFEEMKYRGKGLECYLEIDPYQVGRSLGASILDLTGAHPNSRIPGSEHRNLSSVRDWLRTHTRTMRPQLTMSRLRPKTSSPTRAPLYVRSKGKVVDERKENTYAGAKSDVERRRSPPRAGALAPRSGHELTVATPPPKYGKKNEPVKSSSRTRYLADTEPKPKTLATKRRNILAIRKPNTSKTVLPAAATASKTKAIRRSADDAQTSSLLSAKLSKRSFTRSVREKRGNRCRAMASSSSEELVVAAGRSWEEPGAVHPEAPAAGKRRPFQNHSPSRLKKIRLKTGL